MAQATFRSTRPARSHPPACRAGAQGEIEIMAGRHSTWTAEDDERLRRLAEEGHNVRSISERLERTPDAVRMRSKLFNIPTVKAINGASWSLDEDAQLRKLAQTGLSIPEIAADIHRSTSVVRRRAGKLQINIAGGLNGVVRAALEERLGRSSAALRPSEKLQASQHSVSVSQIGLKAKI
jgi:hypothetical protein